MAIRRETIGKQIKRVRAAFKNRDDVTGRFFNTRRELSTRLKKVTMVGLFVSDENTFLVRPHVFNALDGRNAAQWDDWFAEHYGGILRETILPHMEIRTGKQWRLYRIIGVLPNDNTGLVRAKTSVQRNKTKRKRRQNGRSSTRRR